MTIGMIFGIPIIQIMLFGYAINTDIRWIPTVVMDSASTQGSRNLISDLEASQVIKVTGYVQTPNRLTHFFPCVTLTIQNVALPLIPFRGL
jgi:ABC-2 type transport system permease protein